MKFDAHFHFTDGETLRSAAHQTARIFSASLGDLAEPAPAFERVSCVYVLLTLTATFLFKKGQSRGSFHRASDTYHIWSDVDPIAFASSGWDSRVQALAEGVRAAVPRIAKTRVSEAERLQLLEWISIAEQAARNAEPAELVSINGAELANPVQHDPPPPSRHVRLYKLEGDVRHYREMWFHDGVSVEHAGVVGEIGTNKARPVASDQEGDKALELFEKAARQDGFRPISMSKQARLIVEYASDTLTDELDVAAVEKLDQTLGEILGWTGLGYCDGGSSGSGTAELCCFVVDFNLGKKVLERELPKAGWTQPFRIYRET